MSAGDNLAHLNSLLGGLERPRALAHRVTWDDEHEVDDEYESDEDYTLDDAAVAALQASAGEELVDAVVDTWKEQRGLCAITGICIEASSTGLYGLSVVPKRFSRPLADDNHIVVASAVARMRDAVDLPWTAFRSMLRQLAVGAQGDS